MYRMCIAEAFGHQHLHRLTNELVAFISENGAGVGVDARNRSVLIRNQNRIRQRFEERFEPALVKPDVLRLGTGHCFAVPFRAVGARGHNIRKVRLSSPSRPPQVTSTKKTARAVAAMSKRCDSRT